MTSCNDLDSDRIVSFNHSGAKFCRSRGQVSAKTCISLPLHFLYTPAQRRSCRGQFTPMNYSHSSPAASYPSSVSPSIGDRTTIVVYAPPFISYQPRVVQGFRSIPHPAPFFKTIQRPEKWSLSPGSFHDVPPLLSVSVSRGLLLCTVAAHAPISPLRSRH